MNLLSYSGIGTITVLLVNFFFIDYKLTAFFFVIFAFQPYNSPDYIFYALLLLMIFSVILRLIILPVLYGYMENHSKDKIVLEFIQNLRKSWKWKVGILLFSALTALPFGISNFSQMLFATILFTGFSSYLILFIWWWIQDLIKNKKNEII